MYIVYNILLITDSIFQIFNIHLQHNIHHYYINHILEFVRLC